MALAELVVLHRRRTPGELSSGVTAAPLAIDACVIDTCLRQVYIGTRGLLSNTALVQSMEVHQGAEAYRFLMGVACGLESEIAGETEILGQVKNALRTFDASASIAARRLRPLMQRMCQDTKEIRSLYLTGQGSTTYGSLVRRLLGGRVTGPTLLVGAGQLAATVLPYLDGAEVSVWNRGESRRDELIATARKRESRVAPTPVASDLESELAAWRAAANIILCIPADAQRDAARVAAWRERSVHAGRVLHLGIETAAGTAWQGVAGLATLGDLFGLRDAQADLRLSQLARARRACAEKAQLALLESSGGQLGSSQHGWEDLGAFQALGA